MTSLFIRRIQSRSQGVRLPDQTGAANLPVGTRTPLYALPTAVFSPESGVSITGGTPQEHLPRQTESIGYSVVRPMRAAHVSPGLLLEDITLPALAYGASMSGTTVGRVYGTTVPLPLAWEP